MSTTTSATSSPARTDTVELELERRENGKYCFVFHGERRTYRYGNYESPRHAKAVADCEGYTITNLDQFEK